MIKVDKGEIDSDNYQIMFSVLDAKKTYAEEPILFRGNLNLSESDVVELPNHIIALDNIDLDYCSKLKSIPEILVTSSLSLLGIKAFKLPDSIEVETIYVDKAKLKKFRDTNPALRRFFTGV